MDQVINIHNKEQKIYLEAGKYSIDVLGGWGVKLGRFSISFVHSQSKQKINCKRSFWPVQSMAVHKRAKRIFTADIMEHGTYEVEFRNPETLRVKHTNLFFKALFEDPIPNEKLFVNIHLR